MRNEESDYPVILFQQVTKAILTEALRKIGDPE
jgi:hypothetical protein